MLNRKNNAGHPWCYHPPAQFPNIAMSHASEQKKNDKIYQQKHVQKSMCKKFTVKNSRNLELHSLKLT